MRERNARNGGKQSASRTRRRAFSIRGQGTSSSATTIKEKKGTNASASLLAPRAPKWWIREFHAIYSGGIQGEDAGKSDDDTAKRDTEGVYRVCHGGRRKRNGRNNVFILCAWLNVFRGLLLETRGSDVERKEEMYVYRYREREREKRNNGIEMYLDLASGFT